MREDHRDVAPLRECPFNRSKRKLNIDALFARRLVAGIAKRT